MTTELGPAPAPLAGAAGAPADLQRHPAVRASSTSATTSARSATTSRLQYEYEAIYCIVDYHALTSTHDADVLRARTREMAASLLALGLDPERCTLFVQSHRPGAHRARLAARDGHAGQLARADADLQGEEASNQPDDVNHGLLTYPVLQAADIVIYKASLRAGRQGPGRPPRAVARDRPRASTAATATRSRSRRPVFTEAPDRPRHGRRPEDEQVGRQHHRRSSAAPDVIRKQVMSMVTDTQADPADRPRPAGGLQRLPAPPLLRRRLRGRSGTASGRPGPAASTRRSCWPSGSSRHYAAGPRALPRADGRPGRGRRDPRGRRRARSRPMAEATMDEVRSKMGLR